MEIKLGDRAYWAPHSISFVRSGFFSFLSVSLALPLLSWDFFYHVLVSPPVFFFVFVVVVLRMPTFTSIGTGTGTDTDTDTCLIWLCSYLEFARILICMACA